MVSTTSRRALGAFGVAAALIASQLVAAPAASADDDDDPLCYTTQSTVDPFYPGPSASRVYDWVNTGSQTDRRFSSGLPIPDALLDNRYVPQGLTDWSNWDGTGEDLLLISAYEDEDGNKAPDGPSAIFGLVASGERRGTGIGRMLITEGHVGGLAVYKDWLYVGSGQEIRGYRLSRVRDALAGPNRDYLYDRAYNRPTSYTVGFMGTGDGRLWAGAFDKDETTHLNAYAQTSNADGTLDYRTQYFAPKKTQGVTVTPNYVIFSTSYDRNERGNLWIKPRDQDSRSDSNSYCFRTPSMNQGVTILNGRLYLGFESGAYTYNHDWNTPRNPIRRVHSAALSDITSLYSSGPSD